MTRAVFLRRIRAAGGWFTIHAVPSSMTFGGQGKMVEEAEGYRFYVVPDGAPLHLTPDIKFTALPDEQSIATLWLWGERRRITTKMVELAQRLRAGLSPVKCFVKGCRKNAVLYAKPPSDEGGSWYACSRDHVSKTSTKGWPLREEDYRLIGIEGFAPAERLATKAAPPRVT